MRTETAVAYLRYEPIIWMQGLGKSPKTLIIASLQIEIRVCERSVAPFDKDVRYFPVIMWRSVQVMSDLVNNDSRLLRSTYWQCSSQPQPTHHFGQPPPSSPNQIHHHMYSQLWGKGGSTARPLANYQGTDDGQHIKAIGNALTTRLSRDENKELGLLSKQCSV